MSATKTLLEFAAKAAGIKLGLPLSRGGFDNEGGYWNPLTDSAAALELAAMLCLTVQIGKLDGTVVVTSNNDNRIYAAEHYEFDLDSKMEAIRIAIVCAAADIGMKLP